MFLLPIAVAAQLHLLMLLLMTIFFLFHSQLFVCVYGSFAWFMYRSLNRTDVVCDVDGQYNRIHMAHNNGHNYYLTMTIETLLHTHTQCHNVYYIHFTVNCFAITRCDKQNMKRKLYQNDIANIYKPNQKENFRK